MTEWKDDQPIFRQLACQISDQILQGVWLEQQALPSVRAVAADLKSTALLSWKTVDLLVDEDLVEKKRGKGMYVAEGHFKNWKSPHINHSSTHRSQPSLRRWKHHWYECPEELIKL